jgi:hypothetical protein
MKNKRIAILWGRDDVLSRAVELILASNKSWEVITIRDTHSLEELQKTVEDLDPKVIIINQGENKSCTDEVKSLPLHLIQKQPGLKVITMNLDTNTAEVYNKQQVYIKEICDLLNTVEDC